MSSRPLLLLAVLVLVPTAAACSDDSADDDASATTTATTTAAEQPEGEVCDELRAVRDFDDESQALLEESIPPLLSATTPEEVDAAFAVYLQQFQPFVEENLPDLLETYDALAALVPDEIGLDVIALRDFTASFAGGLADATSRDEVQALFDSVAEQATPVAEATLRIDQFSRDTCDITIAN